MIGEHERALDAARQVRQQHPEGDARLLRVMAATLAALARVEELNLVQDAIEDEVELPEARSALVQVVETLRAYGYAAATERAIRRALDWFEGSPPGEKSNTDHRQQYGRLLFLAGQLDEAQEVYDALVDELPASRSSRMVRAYIAAHRGDTAQALIDLNWFHSLVSHDGEEEPTWYRRGVILGALGDHQRAIGLLRDADRNGDIANYETLRTDMELDPLRDHPEFQELIRPKG